MEEQKKGEPTLKLIKRTITIQPSFRVMKLLSTAFTIEAWSLLQGLLRTLHLKENSNGSTYISTMNSN